MNFVTDSSNWRLSVRTQIFSAQQVIYLIKAIKSNNTDLIVGISTVKNDLKPSDKANDSEKSVSYLKNCVT